MSKFRCQELDSNQLEKIKKNFESVDVQNDFEIIYQDHIPPTSFVLIEGEAEYFRNKRKVGVKKEGILVGLVNICHEIPIKNTWKIKSPAKIILLDKSTIFNIFSKKDSKIADFFSALIKI